MSTSKLTLDCRDRKSTNKMSAENKELFSLQWEPYPLTAGARETRQNEGPLASDSDSEGSLARGYRCRLCSYETRELSSFSEHLRATHPIDLKRPSAGNPETAPRNGEILPPGPGRKSEGGSKDRDVVAVPGKRKRKLLTVPKEDPRGKVKTPKLPQKNSAANFSTNHNSVVCLPLVSEGLKLVWTQSDQTSALDSDDGLVEAFNRFPYPSAGEIQQLCRASGLPLDKVKVWFMVQRIKYGISWSSEEIEETRLKLGQVKGEEEGEEEEEEEGAVDLGEEVNGLERNGVAKTEENGNTRLSLTNGLKPELQGGSACPVAATTGANGAATGSVKKSSRDVSSSPLSASSAPQAPVSSPSPASGRYKKSKAQLAALRSSFGGQHFPSETELRRLQDETGLTRNEIRKWFSDSRYQLKNNRASGGNPAPGIPVASPNPNPSSFFESFLNRSLEAVRGLGSAEEEGPAGGGGGGGEGEGEGEAEERLPVEEKSEPGPMQQTPLQGNSRSRTCARKGKSTPVSLPGPSPSDPPGPSPLTPSGRRRKTKEQLAILKAFFLRCQWPLSSDYSQLVLESGLPRPDVIQWFGDTRYAVKNGQLRWVRGAGAGSDIASDILQQQQQSAPHIAAAPSNGRAKRRREGGSNAGVRQGASADAAAPGSNPSVDMRPLERYLSSTGFLQERDLDLLCKKSRMTYQQVRDWFLCQQLGMAEVEVDISDGEE